MTTTRRRSSRATRISTPQIARSSTSACFALGLLLAAALPPVAAANPAQHVPPPPRPDIDSAHPRLPPGAGETRGAADGPEAGSPPEPGSSERSILEYLDETPPEGEGDVPGWLSRKRRWREEATRARDTAQEALKDANEGAVPPTDEERIELQEALGRASEELDLATRAADAAEARSAGGEPWTELQDAVDDLVREGSLLAHYESEADRAEYERRSADDPDDAAFWAVRREGLLGAGRAALARFEDAAARARAAAATDAEREVVTDLLGRIAVMRTLREIASDAREAWRRLRGGDADRGAEAEAIMDRTRAEASGADERFRASAERARTVAAGGELDHAAELEAARRRKEQAEREFAEVQRRLRELPFDAEPGEYSRLAQEHSRLAAEVQITDTDYRRTLERARAAGAAPSP